MKTEARLDQLKEELRRRETEMFEIQDIDDLDVQAADWGSSTSTSYSCSCFA